MVISNIPRVGHVARNVALPLALLFLWDCGVTYLYLRSPINVRPLELPLSLFGTAIALFLGFMVNAAYARWWEARGLWGLMINASRNIAREALTFVADGSAPAERDIAREIVCSQIAFVNVLRTALRGQAIASEAATYLTPSLFTRLGTIVNKPNYILTHIGRLATDAHKAGMMDSYSRVRMEATLVDIANAQGGMERIKNTPLPNQYRFFPVLFARVFCILLPFAVVDDLGILTPIGSALVSLMFLMALQIGNDLMNPFANEIHDVPMTSMCRTVEIDLLQMKGDAAPDKIAPVHGVMW